MSETLGSFEHVVLLAVLHLRDGAYSVPIRGAIEDRTGRSVTRGALYTTLMRLEEKNLLASSMGEPTAVRGGRAKRFYTVTAMGRAALRASRSQLMEAWPGAATLLRERGA